MTTSPRLHRDARPDNAFLRAVRVACYLLVAAALIWLIASAWQPVRLNWGDPSSDTNVLNGLRYSTQYGFFKTAFMEVLDIGPLGPESCYYTHYPPLPSVVHGLLENLVGGGGSIVPHRLLAILFSALSLLLLRRYVAAIWGETTGALAMALLATNLLWFQYADSIHQAPVMGALGFAVLVCAQRYLAGTGGTRSLVGLAVAGFGCYLASYDYYFLLPIAVVATALFVGRRLLERKTVVTVVVLGTAAVLAFVAKSLLIVWALGWQGFKHDLVFQFFERATATRFGEYRAGLIAVLATRTWIYLSPLFFALVAYHVWAAIRAVRARLVGAPRAPAAASPEAPLWFLLAGLPFLVVFSQLAVEQLLPFQVLLPYYAIGFAVLLGTLMERRGAPRVVASVALAALAGWNAAHALAFDKAYLDAGAVAKVRAYLDEHDRNDFVFTNLLDYGPIMAFLDRHYQPAHDGRTGSAGDFYHSILASQQGGTATLVFFTDPNTRFIDKGLWPLLWRDGHWAWIGASLHHRDEGLRAIAGYDASVLAGIAPFATKVVDAGSIVVYRLDNDDPEKVARIAALQAPTRAVQFGDPEGSADLLLYGFRWPEGGKEAGWRWTVPHQMLRTVQTMQGLQWKPRGPARMESALRARLEPGRGYRATVTAWGAYDGQWLQAVVNETPVLARTALATGLTHQTISFDIPASALHDAGIQLIRFEFAGVNEAGVGVALRDLQFAPQ